MTGRRDFLKLLLLAAGSSLVIPGCSGRYFYCDSSARAPGSGLSWQQAWNSLAAIDASVFMPGDVLVIRGRYTEPLEFRASGTAQAPIYIICSDSSNDVSAVAARHCLNLLGDYLTVIGCHWQGARFDGMAGGQCIWSEGRRGIRIMASNPSFGEIAGIQLRSCADSLISDCHPKFNLKGIVVSSNASNPMHNRNNTIRRCQASGNLRWGIQVGGGNGQPNGGGNVVEYCRASGNGTALYLEDADDWWIHDCLLENPLGTGGSTGNTLLFENTCRATLERNVIAAAADGRDTIRVRLNGGSFEDVCLRNNYIVVGEKGRNALHLEIATPPRNFRFSANTVVSSADGVLLYLTASENSCIEDNVLVGGSIAIQLVYWHGEADGWSLERNVFEGQQQYALNGGATLSEFNVLANLYRSEAAWLAHWQGKLYVADSIQQLDSLASVNLDPGYIGPLQGDPMQRDYRMRAAGFQARGVDFSPPEFVSMLLVHLPF